MDEIKINKVQIRNLQIEDYDQLAWARPISSPSAVIKELSAIFWDLNGATR